MGCETMEKRRVRLEINGVVCGLITQESDDYMKKLAAEVGELMTEIQIASPYITREAAALTVALSYCDDATKNGQRRQQLQERVDELEVEAEIWQEEKADMLKNGPGPETRARIQALEQENTALQESAQELANKINGGALPFELETENYSTIDPTLGTGARDAMVLAGVIAFILICIFMITVYRLPGFIACIALAGQVGGMIASLTGFFPGMSSFTLTIPGIAGIILSIGMGVDANIITAERIKEEINSGKSIDGAIELGYQRAFSAIFDGNVTCIIVAIILMGTFGPPDSFFAVIMSPLLSWFPPSTEGAIFSFGYTLFTGMIANFVFGVLASKYMTKPISRFKCFRHPKFYGGRADV